MTTQSLLPNDLIDALLSNYKKPEDLIGENGLLKQLTKALVERVLQAEMTEHLGIHLLITQQTITATVKAPRHLKEILAHCLLKFPVIVMAASSRN